MPAKSLLLWTTKVPCSFFMVPPIKLHLKNKSLKMSELWCWKKEVIRSFGKQNTHKSSSMEHTFSKKIKSLGNDFKWSEQTHGVKTEKKKKKKFISTLGSFLKLSYYQFWKNFPIKDDFVDLSMDRHQSDFIGIHGFKEVQYNSSEHHSVQLFIIAISSHSHIRQKQPQETFLQYSCFINNHN